jgi:CBS domain containing-hemolysin-like protein
VIEFAIIAGLIAINGIFVAAEFAIVGAPRAAIEARAAQGDRLAALVHSVLQDPRRQDRYIATAQFGITSASLGLGMYGEHVLADALYHLAGGAGTPEWLASHALASVAAVAILTYFHIVVGEMVPKSLALQHAGALARWITPPMIWTTTALFPVVVALNGIGNGLLRLAGMNRQLQTADQYYTAEELQLIVQESGERGAMRSDSSQMIQELFEFGDLTAGQVMVPRVRISGLTVGTPPERIRAVLEETPHTRYPVYEKDLDHILGMVHIKDLLALLVRAQPLAAEDVRPVPVVPETAPLDTVLATMRRDRTQMVVVIDEHGGTAGVVTIEDLFEEVVGDIEEGRGSASQIYPDALGRLRVPGTMRVDEVGQEFDLDLEHEEVDSVSGLVLALLGRPPEVGDTVEYDRLRFEVTAVKGHGVEECAVSLLEAPAGGTPDHDRA